MVNYGIVLCSRFDSSRIFKKPFRYIGSKMIIEHLLDRLLKSKINIYLAVPTEQLESYRKTLFKYLEKNKTITLIGGSKTPLNRMRDVARYYNIKNIIRVCHDKIFVEPGVINYAIKKYEEEKSDYLYSSEFVAGTGFEIISFDIIEAASKKYRDIEHISYAVKNLTKKQTNLSMVGFYKDNYGVKFYSHVKKLRLLIDYPEDIIFIKHLFRNMGENIILKQIIEYIFYDNIQKLKINILPEITVYTCVHNGERYIKQCVESVINQGLFKSGLAEYIIIDDYSIDRTRDILDIYRDRIKIIHNKNNLGLASSSNVALEKAAGEHIIRMDADDYFMNGDSLDKLYQHIIAEGFDVTYPAYHHGSKKRVIHGAKNHHVGGALFNKRAINNIKFTDGLRGYEGLDFFERAKEMLSIDYYNEEPVFWYRQRKKSMSNTNKEYRGKIKKNINKGVLGSELNDICSA